MKKGLLTFLIFISFIGLTAQEKKGEKTKDTVRTEIVNVVTTYNPKIADANKIKKTPEINLSEKSKKKRLQYTIFSAPVASTFKPKTGVVKGIDVGVKEQIYNNYLAAGFGNYTTPFLEASLHYDTRFKNEMGLYAKYISSNENLKNTGLNSTFSNFNTALYYKQNERYFDWKVTLNSAQNKYNWYGVPTSIAQSTILDFIEAEQTYNFIQLAGDLEFKDSFIKKSNAAVSYFSDALQSKEILAFLKTKFNFPLDFINNGLKDLSLDTKIEILKGSFKNNAIDNTGIDYSIVTAKIHPEYRATFNDISLKAGFKLFASFDTENSATNILVYPDVVISTPIIKDYLNAYTGVTGDLKTNTYKGFTEENPYISPTLFMTQTSEKMTVFLGTKGKINNDFSFHFKASYKNEEDKPFFRRNNSKSDGTNLIANSIPLKGYEFGNSFEVVYDDVITTSFLGEFEYDLTKRITTGATIQYDLYELKNLEEAWNLPALQMSVFGKYKNDKWYATTNIFFVGDRKAILYNGAFSSNTATASTINSFVDFNLNGGYHFNDTLSVFLKLNNVLNANYQRFANFDVQGFQVLGGLTYKFDF